MAQKTLEKFEGENNFKQTEVGLIPKDWEVVRFEGAILKKKIRVGKIKQQEYKPFGKYPVIDQSQNYIAGFCDDDEKAYRGPLPVIIFGDHTRIFKFVDFPFIVGADGVKVLIPNKELFDPKFLFFAFLTLNIPSRGYNRHFPLLKEKKIPLPPLPEQRKIAKVLDTIQKAIEIQDRIIEQAKNLKKSLMQKLFTEGLCGEEQKETEIGLIPKSWKVVRLERVVEFSRKPRNLRIKENDEIPFIPMELIPDSGKYAGWLMKKYSEISSGTFVFKDDIIVAKITPSFENGKQALLTNLPMEFGYATTEVFAFHPKDEDIIREYIFEYLRLPRIRSDLTSKMEGTTGRKRLPRNALENLLIPLPPLEEQKQTAHILSVVDKKIEVEQKRKQSLKELFKTMLHKLMSGEIRLKEVEV